MPVRSWANLDLLARTRPILMRYCTAAAKEAAITIDN
jgi:hypothetical protein